MSITNMLTRLSLPSSFLSGPIKGSLGALASKRMLSDALFVHREKDSDVSSFTFDAANKNVSYFPIFTNNKRL